MSSLDYENINYVMSQFLKLSCVSLSYVNISYVLALKRHFITFRAEEIINNTYLLVDKLFQKDSKFSFFLSRISIINNGGSKMHFAYKINPHK